MAQMDRRKFLRGLLAAPVAAIAAKAAIDTEYVPEMKQAALEELIELRPGKIQVAAPKEIFNPNKRLWRSVTGEAEAWAAYLSGKTKVRQSYLKKACYTLARAIDRDLKDAEIGQDKHIQVDLPHVSRVWEGYAGEQHCEIAIGLEKLFTPDIFGNDRYRVGYIGSDDVQIIGSREAKAERAAAQPKV